MAKIISTNAVHGEGFLRSLTTGSIPEREHAQTLALYAELKRRHATSLYTSPDLIGDLATTISERAIGNRAIPDALRQAITTAARESVQLEAHLFSLPHVHQQRSMAEGVALRASLRRQIAFFDHHAELTTQWLDILIRCFKLLLDAFPETAQEPTTLTLTVPLIDLAEQPGRLITDLISSVLRLASMSDEPLIRPGAELARVLTNNLLTASNLSFTEAQKTPHRLQWPHTQEKLVAPQALLETYLAGAPFYNLLAAPVAFIIPRRLFTEHFFCCAPSGFGKTQLLQSLILSFLQEPDPPGMFILDSQDDEDGLLRKLEHLEVFNPENGRLRDRLLILSPEDKPALNLFQIGSTDTYDPQLDDLFVYLATAIDREFTAKQATAVLYVQRLLAKIPNVTASTLKDIMEAKTPIYTEQLATLDKTVQDFFANQFYSKSEMGATRLQVASRLYTLLSNPNFLAMFAAPQNKFDAFQAMQQKKIVLINTSIKQLGTNGSQIFGRFVVSQCLAAAYRRGDLPSSQRPLSLLILDEAAPYLDEKTEILLSTARKFNLGFLAATQLLDRIPPSVKAAIVANTTIKLAGPVSYQDANALAHEMYTTNDFIRSMTKDATSTNFACHVRGLTHHAIKLTVPFGTLENLPRMTTDQHRILRQTNRARYGSQQTARLAPQTLPTGTDHAKPSTQKW